MAATEEDHNRCHATYFDRCDEMDVKPLVQWVSMHGPDPVVPEFGAKVYLDTDTGRTFVFWTDFVANDWAIEANGFEDALALLTALTTAVTEDRMFTDDERKRWGIA